MEREHEMNFSSNTTVNMVMNTTGNQQLYSHAGLVIISLIVAAIITVTVVGNIFVILAYCRDWLGKQKRYNLLILNLAITDLVIGVFSMTFNLSRFIHGFWPYGEIICKLWTILDFTVCWMSIITIFLISWYRYTAFRFMYTGHILKSKKRLRLIIISCWIIVVIYWSLIAFTWGPITGKKAINYDKTCRMEFNYKPYAPLFINLIPFSILLSTAIAMHVYVHITISKTSKIKRRVKDTRILDISRPYSNKKPPSQPIEQVTIESSSRYTPSEGPPCLEQADEVKPQNTMNATDEPVGSRPDMPDYNEIANEFKLLNESKIIITNILFVLATPIGCIILFLLPYEIMTVVFSLCGSDCVSDVLWEVTEVLAWCNSTINPVIYVALVHRSRVKKAIYSCLQKCCPGAPCVSDEAN